MSDATVADAFRHGWMTPPNLGRARAAGAQTGYETATSFLSHLQRDRAETRSSSIARWRFEHLLAEDPFSAYEPLGMKPTSVQ